MYPVVVIRCFCYYYSFVIIIVNGFVSLPVTTRIRIGILQQQLLVQQSVDDNSNESSSIHKQRQQQQQNQQQQQYSIIDTSSYDYYDEQKPRRRSLLLSSSSSSSSSSATTIDTPGSTRKSSSSPLQSWKSKVNPWNDWGVERQQVQQQQSFVPIPFVGHNTNTNNNNNNNPIEFPHTYNDVANAIVTTCINVLYNTAAFDPNIVQNAYVGTSDIYRHRPTHIFPKDTSRIGIEIDTPSFLQHSTSTAGCSEANNNNNNQQPSAPAPTSTISSNEQSLRYLSLLVASTFSITQWDFDTDDTDGDNSTTGSNKDSNNNSENCSNKTPVFIYYNTVQQALYASQQLQQLQAIERRSKLSSSSQQQQQPTKYDHIIILSLQDPLPIHLIGKSSIITNIKKRYITAKQKKLKYQKSSNVDPSKGIVIIVQPTDYNYEQNQQQNQQNQRATDFSSSSTASSSTTISTTTTARKVMTTTTTIPDAITNVQCIVATAAIQQIPVIMISPRFIQQQQQRDQSGYQQSSIYGGYEPPDGPTPWLLRDFSPPAFCWIGDALQTTTTTSTARIPALLSSSSSSLSTVGNNDCTYSRVSLFQSVLYPGHSWHLFAAKECHNTKSSSTNSNDKHTSSTRTTTTSCQSSSSLSSYEYLCSTRKASGRPTRDVLRRLFYEFASYDV